MILVDDSLIVFVKLVPVFDYVAQRTPFVAHAAWWVGDKMPVFQQR